MDFLWFLLVIGLIFGSVSGITAAIQVGNGGLMAFVSAIFFVMATVAAISLFG